MRGSTICTKVYILQGCNLHELSYQEIVIPTL